MCFARQHIHQLPNVGVNPLSTRQVGASTGGGAESDKTSAPVGSVLIEAGARLIRGVLATDHRSFAGGEHILSTIESHRAVFGMTVCDRFSLLERFLRVRPHSLVRVQIPPPPSST